MYSRKGTTESVGINQNLTQNSARRDCLPIDIFAVFNRQDIQPPDSSFPVKDSIGPDSVGPDLIFVEFAFQRFAIEGMVSEVRMASLILSRVPASKDARSLIA